MRRTIPAQTTLELTGQPAERVEIPYGQAGFNDLVNSPKSELKIFTEREGGVEHRSIGNLPVVREVDDAGPGEAVQSWELRGCVSTRRRRA
jgi:hypothetical protein